MNVSHLLHLLITIYTFSEAVSISGGWGEWGDWSDCSVTCGSGTTKRYRNWEYEDGSILNFTYIAIEACWAKPPCPVHGNWGMWTAWSRCPVMCGGGIKIRTRLCDSPEPSNEGDDCEDAGHEKVVCNPEDCPELPLDFDITLCNETTYMCDNYLQCVDLERRCDGKLHCHDGSDEKGCYRYLYINNQGCPASSVQLSVVFSALMLTVSYSAIYS